MKGTKSIERKQTNSKVSKKKELLKKRNQSILMALYVFSGLLFLTMGYFAYYMTVESGEVVNNPYNKRQSILSKRVIRGSILASDGQILAQTVTNEAGEEERYYPYGPVFSHVVGRDKKGLTGIEEIENIRLLTSNINPFDKIQNELSYEKSQGNNVITTLDLDLQQVAYDALGNYRGSVVVMEPDTGKILALVSKPSYDPNEIDELWEDLIEDKEEKSSLLNRATQGLYTPGSTFKLLTTLEYMRENPDYTEFEHNCTGKIEYDGMTIHCYNDTVHGKVDFPTALAKSCNTAYVAMGMELDVQRFATLCNSFLFNTNLPVRLTNNGSKFTLNPSQGVKASMQTAMGQGKTVITPLHNAMITATIANKGIMMKPYVVDRIENINTRIVKSYVPQQHTQPMTQEEANYIADMMRAVVTKGTASKLGNLDVEVAGKTGSADQEGKKAHAWFVGYAPYDNPEIVLSIIVENVGTGSDYAVPIAKKVLDAYFSK